MDDTKPGQGKGLEAKNPVYSLLGSTRDIIDPLESIIKKHLILLITVGFCILL